MQPTLASTVIIVTTLKILDINVDSFVSCGTISSNITAEESSKNESFISSSEPNNKVLEDINGAKTTLFIRSTLPPIEAKSKLNPSTNCKNNSDCEHIYGAQCNKRSKICVCKSIFPASDGKKCYNAAKYEEFCRIDDQCQVLDKNTLCDKNLHVCTCNPIYAPDPSSSGHQTRCIEADSKSLDMSVGSYVDPTLFGIMGGLALMFIAMCVVLQIFAKAQFQENRSIFNTPNARIANASVMKGSIKYKKPQTQTSVVKRIECTDRGGSARKSSNDMNEDILEETELKIRENTNERRIKKKSSSACLNSSSNGNNVESQFNISSQGRRKRSSAHTVTGSSNNLGPDSSSSQGRRSAGRTSSPSPFDSRNMSPNGPSSRKSSDADSDRQKRSSVPKSERKTSNERSFKVNIEESPLE